MAPFPSTRGKKQQHGRYKHTTHAHLDVAVRRGRRGQGFVVVSFSPSQLDQRVIGSADTSEASRAQDQSGWHKPAEPREEQDKCTAPTLYQRLACFKILIKARRAPPPPFPVEIGVQTRFCFSWPAGLLWSSPFEFATRLLRRSAVTLQHKEATVFLQRFSNLRNVFQLSFVRGKRDNGEKRGKRGLRRCPKQ